MIISLFGKIEKDTKLVYKYGDSVVIGSHTKKEYAFQVGNFLNMLYSNIEKESKCMTNSVVLHNLSFEIRRLKEDTNLYTELIRLVQSFPIGDKELCYEQFDRIIDVISISLEEYYFKPI